MDLSKIDLTAVGPQAPPQETSSGNDLATMDLSKIDLSKLPGFGPTPGSEFLEGNPFGTKGALAHGYSGFMSSATSPLTLLGTPVGWVNPRAGETVKNFFHVIPKVEKATTLPEKIAEAGGGLLGMAVPTAPLKYLKWAQKLPAIAQAGLVGALWGISEDSGMPAGSAEDMQARVDNAKSQALMFAGLHGAGATLEAIIKKMPGVTDALSRLTPEHAKQVTSLFKSGVLGAGLGASEPADTANERLANMAVGGLSFPLAELPFMRNIGLQGLREDTAKNRTGWLSKPENWTAQDKGYMTWLGNNEARGDPFAHIDRASVTDLLDKAKIFQTNSENVSPEGQVEEVTQKFGTDINPSLQDLLRQNSSERRAKYLRRWNAPSEAPDVRQAATDSYERAMGKGTFGLLSKDAQDAILNNLAWDPNQLHNTLKAQVNVGKRELTAEDFRKVFEDQRGYRVADMRDMSTNQLAYYVMDNKDLFPKGINDLKLYRNGKPLPGANADVMSFRNSVGGELKKLRDNKTEVFPYVEKKEAAPLAEKIPAAPTEQDITDKIIEKMALPDNKLKIKIMGEKDSSDITDFISSKEGSALLEGLTAQVKDKKLSLEEAKKLFNGKVEPKPTKLTGEAYKTALDNMKQQIREIIETRRMATLGTGKSAIEVATKKPRFSSLTDAVYREKYQNKDGPIGALLRAGYEPSEIQRMGPAQRNELVTQAENKLTQDEDAALRMKIGEETVSVDAAIAKQAQSDAEAVRNSIPQEIGHDTSYQIEPTNGKDLVEILEEKAKREDYVEKETLAAYVAHDMVRMKKKFAPEEKMAIDAILNSPRETLNEEQKSLLDTTTEKIVSDLSDRKITSRQILLSDLSAEYQKTGKSVRFWYDGVPFTYHEETAGGVTRRWLYDDMETEIPSDRLHTPITIQGELNDPATTFSGTIGRFRKFSNNDAIREELNFIEKENNPAVQEYMRARLALKAQPFSWLNNLTEWAAKKLPGMAQSMSMGKQKPEVIERLSIPLEGINNYANYKMVGVIDYLHQVLARSGFTTEGSHKLLGNIFLKTYLPDYKEPYKWMMAKDTIPEDRVFVKLFEKEHPELFKTALYWKSQMDKATLDWIGSTGRDFDVWREKMQKGYLPFDATKSEEEVINGIQKRYGISTEGAKARWERMKENRTVEEFDQSARNEGLIPDWDIASLVGKRMGDGLKRLALVEIIKDMKGWKAPDSKYNMFEVPRPGVTGKDLRDAGYTEAGKSIRWLNYVLPTGAEIEAYVHPDIAKEFKYLYDGGQYGNFSRAYRKFQGTVKNLILWHPLFVAGDVTGPVSSVLGLPEFARILKKSTSLQTFFGKEEVPFVADEATRARFMKSGLVFGKELIYKALDFKMREAGSWFKDQESKKSLLDMAKSLSQEHFGVNKWMWSLVDNYNLAMAMKLSERFEKMGFSRDLSDKWASQVANDAIQNLPSRIWSRDTSKLMGFMLLAKSYTTATLRVASGAFPFLEKIPWRPLHHEVTSPVARSEMAKIYQNMLVKQALGMILTSNLLQLAFTGSLSIDNEEGHKFDIKTPITKPDGTPIYINVPFFRQFESLIKAMPEFMGIGPLKGEMSTARWFNAKMDPVTRELKAVLSNYDDRMHQEIVTSGAPPIDHLTERLTHIASNLQPIPIGKWSTPTEKLLSLTGLRVTPGYPGGDEARRLEEGIQTKEWQNTKTQRGLRGLEPGSQEAIDLLLSQDKAQSLKNYFIKSTNPLLYKKIRAKSVGVF